LSKDQKALVDSLFLRIEPGIKQLIPKATVIDLMKYKSALKQTLVNIVIKPNEFSLAGATEYIEYGYRDFQAAKLLYRNGEVAPSIYHISQAYEKAIKAFCAAVGVTTLEELRIHCAPRILLQMIKTHLNTEMANILKSLHNKDYRDLLKQANRLVNSEPSKLAKLSMKSTDREVGIEDLICLADNLLAANPQLEETETAAKNVFMYYLPEYSEYIDSFSTIVLGQASGQCYLFGLITYAHENYTRYPNGILAITEYADPLGIVQAAPLLIERIPKTLEIVKQVISMQAV